MQYIFVRKFYYVKMQFVIHSTETCQTWLSNFSEPKRYLNILVHDPRSFTFLEALIHILINDMHKGLSHEGKELELNHELP